MTWRTILLDVGSDAHKEARMAVALQLARRFDARLCGLVVVPPLRLPLTFGDTGLTRPRQVEAHRDALIDGAERELERFRQRADQAGVSSDGDVLEGEPGPLFAERARLYDLTILSQAEREALARRPPEEVVLGSGRGTLVVPYAGRFETVGERVLVAWNGSRESARAVAEAMPLLEQARDVVVLEMDPGPDGGSSVAIARSLAHHGIKAEARHTVTAGVAPGEILLSTAAETGADLLVMGAYGHTRLREVALGGVTRTILGHMTLPVLLAY